MKIKRIEKIMRQFVCTTKTEYYETIQTYSAIFKLSYGYNYVLKVESMRYEDGILKSTNIAHVYFNSFEEIEKRLKLQYDLCKENLYTKDIKITI